MLVEYATGSDSFPAGRNCSLSTLIYNPRKAVFENPRNIEGTDAVARNTKVTQGLPSVLSLSGVTNMWYYYRTEARSRSLWLFHLRYLKPHEGPFSFENEYLLLRMQPEAPLLRAKVEFPAQADANVNQLEFTWNASRIETDDEVSADEKNAFKLFLSDTDDDVVRVSQQKHFLPSWKFVTLEAGEKPKRKTMKAGTKTVGITRLRRLRF